MQLHVLEKYCQQWKLSNPSLITSTATSEIYTVQFQGQVAILKILNSKGKKIESQSAAGLRYFQGHGAVKLYLDDPGAQLLEFIDGQMLANVVAQGKDAEATEIICSVIKKLHHTSGPAPQGFASMKQNFHSLFALTKSEERGSIYLAGAHFAKKLIESEQEVQFLHGDLHHENILESSERGWIAIDPQCLMGERTYDVANTFYNPIDFQKMASSPKIIQKRSQIFARELQLDPRRILEFAFAYGCLSASWAIEDGESPQPTMKIARVIQTLLENE